MGSNPERSEGMLTVEDTGLGLSIIINILHGCGGHILVDSAQGKGTTFKLLFPIG